ncbi:MAG: TetR/AcrR family transcriptional regulator [Dehalococcoidia bacterium]|nr:TetR/AcrR family transcriptional regulator [Dehalococcoidia bacterium]
MTVRAPRRDETRSRIIQGALELFARDGFDNTTVRGIARRVGLTDAALYYHFKSKREILEAIWEMPGGVSPSQIHVDAPLTAPQLCAIVESLLEFAHINRDFITLVNRENLAGDETARAIRHHNRAHVRRIFHQHLLTITTPEDADLRSDALVTLILGGTLRASIQQNLAGVESDDDPVDRERILRAAVHLAGLAEAGVR